MRVTRTAAVVLLAVGVAVADSPRPAAVEFIDDADVLERFTKRIGALAKADKCLKPDDVKGQVEKEKSAALPLTRPSDKPLSPEDLAEKLRPSVFLLGSVVGDARNGFDQGRMATAWAAGADGVLVTNWHVFDQIEGDEFYGAMNHKGEVFPLVKVLAADRVADVAVVQINAKGLTPLPLAPSPPRIGSWVGVLGHPGDRYYTFTQGHVTRYSKYTEDDGSQTKWLGVTAEYAYGSSGSPVVDRCGNVVGMAALTENIDYPDDGGAPLLSSQRKAMVRRTARRPKDDPKKEEKAAPPVTIPSAVQMVLKLTVPGSELRAVLKGRE